MAKPLSYKEITKKLEELTNSDYNKIQQEFFKRGIKTPNKTLIETLKFPDLPENEIKKNIEQNLKTLINHLYKIEQDTDLYKSLSCIFGSFLGDSLGAFCEFNPRNKENYKKIEGKRNVFGSEKGMATDDSEMAMSLAYAIMDTPEKDNLNSDFISFYYGLWRKSEPDDIGIATEKALINFIPENYNLLENGKIFFSDNIKETINNLNKDSLANGFLMRKSVFFVWIYYKFKNEIEKAFENKKNLEELYKLFQKIKNLSKYDDQCTHPNPECSIATAYVALIVIAAFSLQPKEIITFITDFAIYVKNKPDEDKDKEKEKEKEEEEEKKIEKDLAQFILDRLDQYSKSKNINYYDFFSQENGVFDKMGYYRHSLRLILYYLYNFDTVKKNDILLEIVKQICNLGGDTDTNAAIVGSVIGPLVGFKSFAKDIKIILEKGRKAYYPIFMVLYLEYLQKNIEPSKKNVLIMILTIIYGRVEEKLLPK